MIQTTELQNLLEQLNALTIEIDSITDNAKRVTRNRLINTRLLSDRLRESILSLIQKEAEDDFFYSGFGYAALDESDKVLVD